jgi:hypothetical protein
MGVVVNFNPAQVVPLHSKRETMAVRTLLDTGHEFDANACGFTERTPPEAGGLRVLIDGRGSEPVLVITTQDGEATIRGFGPIRELCTAAMEAESLARRMSGQPLIGE